MSTTPDEQIEEGRLDLVPMIDCIMLLLLFFILTTKFATEEQAIASMLPTDKGQARRTEVEPPPMVSIRIVPAGLPTCETEREYQRWYDQWTGAAGGREAALQDAELRIGGGGAITMRAQELATPGSPALMQAVEAIHGAIHQQLAAYEVAGISRKDQPDVVIHSFSGLPWRYALIAYDAVRAFEAKHGGVVNPDHPMDLANARGVSFAPPRIRHHSIKELGAELFEIHRAR